MIRKPFFIVLFLFWAIFLVTVVVLNKSSNRLRIEFSLAVISSESDQNIGQFYIDTGRGFNELQSVRLSYYSNAKKAFNRYSVFLPTTGLKFKQLRFDPLPGSGEVILRDITLHCGYPETLEIAEVAQLVKPLHAIRSISRKNNALQIISIGPDPHFLLLSSPPVGPIIRLFKQVAHSQLDKIISGFLSLLLLSGLLAYFTARG